MVGLLSLRPVSSAAATVWLGLCASMPRPTMQLSPVFTDGGDRTGRWAHLSGGAATLLSSHAGRSDGLNRPHNGTRPRTAPSGRASRSSHDHFDTEPCGGVSFSTPCGV